MNVSREEAAAALGSIETAGQRVRTWRGYTEASPYLITWGLIWLVCNGTVGTLPAWGGIAWTVGLAVGTVVTVLVTVRNAFAWKRRFPNAIEESRAIGRRAALLGTTVMLWFPALMLVLGPLTGRQTNAFISLTWAFVYMATGAFIGWRMFAIGLVTAVATVCGFVFLQQHFALWMAVVGGGSLIGGGLWLRKS